MKKIIILIIFVLLLTSCKTKVNNYEIEFNKIENCNKEVINYYNDVYLVCLNDIYLKKDNTITLKDYFAKVFQTFDDSIKSFIDDMKIIEDEEDKVYKKNDLTIIKCNNGNIYFGNNEIDSDYYCNLLINIQDKLIDNVILNNYDNYVGSYIKDDYLIVELVNNNEIEQEYFKNNIINSNKIKFKDGIKYNSSNNSDYLFNYRNIWEELLISLGLDFYGRYNYEIKGDTLEIKYNTVEGWGDIVENDVLIEKSTIILALTNVNKVNWITQNNRKSISINDLDIENIKYYGSSKGLFNELMKSLGYIDTPIKMDISDFTNLSFTLNIKNNSNKRYLYGEGYIIEEYINGVWRKVNLNINVISIGYTLNENESVTKTINLVSKLPKGKYRIIKDFDELLNESSETFNFGKNYYVFVNFDID